MKSSDKIAFIVNPIAGKGRGLSCISLIKKRTSELNGYLVRVTEKRGDATSFAKEAMEDGFDRIVAVGGDGTVNEVGKALVSSKIRLGIVPIGSGNGLARHLKIPMNFSKALDLAIKGNSKVIDTGRINEEVFLNAAGCGIDAQVSKLFSTTNNRGWFNYLKIILKIGRHQKEWNAKIISSEGTMNERITMFTVANSEQFGNNARIAPAADIADGKLDICILYRMNLFHSLYFMLKMMLGKLKDNNYYKCFQLDEFTLDSKEKLAHIDGEPLEVEGLLKFKVVPSSLEVICRL